MVVKLGVLLAWTGMRGGAVGSDVKGQGRWMKVKVKEQPCAEAAHVTSSFSECGCHD